MEDRPGICIAIADNGPGFTVEQRQKAFEPFFTTKVRGTGLGLAICKRLVEAHGGQIELGHAGPGAEVMISTTEDDMTASTRSLRIAVADDEADTRQFFQEVLSRLGHTVVVAAENGRLLVERCRETQPDLVVTDIRMPDMTGLEAAAAVNREQQVPVILVTGHHDADFLRHAGEGYVMACLSKPIKPVDLQAAIALAVLRFDQFRQLAAEAATLRQALEDRKVIERAKGIVMKRLRVDEEDAFRRLRKAATDRNHKLIEVAHRIAAADEVFQQLEPR